MKKIRTLGFVAFIIIAFSILLHTKVAGQVLLNEVEADPNGPATLGCAYIELRGAAATSIPAGTFYLSVDSENAANGFVNESVNLSNVVFGANGTITIIQDETING